MDRKLVLSYETQSVVAPHFKIEPTYDPDIPPMGSLNTHSKNMKSVSRKHISASLFTVAQLTTVKNEVFVDT